MSSTSSRAPAEQRRRVLGRSQRRQAERFAGRDANIHAERETAYEQQMAPVQQQAPAPVAPLPSGEDSVIDQLERLGQLHSSGVLTDEEFAAEKAKLLSH